MNNSSLEERRSMKAHLRRRKSRHRFLPLTLFLPEDQNVSRSEDPKDLLWLEESAGGSAMLEEESS